MTDSDEAIFGGKFVGVVINLTLFLPVTSILKYTELRENSCLSISHQSKASETKLSSVHFLRKLRTAACDSS
jgi:hypothetical protein